MKRERSVEGGTKGGGGGSGRKEVEWPKNDKVDTQIGTEGVHDKKRKTSKSNSDHYSTEDLRVGQHESLNPKRTTNRILSLTTQITQYIQSSNAFSGHGISESFERFMSPCICPIYS